MRGLVNLCGATGAVLLLVPCRTVPNRQDAPAVVVEPNAESRAEIAGAVSASLNGAPVRLADDALTHDSLLVVERARHRDPSGVLIQGRELGKPQRFRLVKNGPDCVLIHEESGKRFKLAGTACAPI